MAHELGKQLHEIMGWPGPMTRRQMNAWREWFRLRSGEPTPEEALKMGRAEAEAAAKAAREDPFAVIVKVKKSDKVTAADLLNQGVSRKRGNRGERS